MPDEQQMPEEGEMPGMDDAPETDVSDEELEEFFDAAMLAQEIQVGYQEQMQGIVENGGLDMEMFNQLMQAEQMGQTAEDVGASDQDQENYEQIMSELDALQEEMEAEIDQAFADEGMNMNMDRFMEINMAVEQDPELQQRLQQMMMEQEGMPAPEEGQPQPDQQPQPEQPDNY